jgi:uncharacterized protein (TIGR03000 family)
MSRVLATLSSIFLFASPAFAQFVVFPDGTTSAMPGGLMIIRQGGQTTWSLGGGIFTQRVKVVANTPEGKDIARFQMPSAFHRTDSLQPLPKSAPAMLQVTLPDPFALLFVDGEMVRTKGTTRQLESPRLVPGKSYPLRMRAAYMVGDKFLIEDKEMQIRANEITSVQFDGSRALVVSLKKDGSWTGPMPSAK